MNCTEATTSCVVLSSENHIRNEDAAMEDDFFDNQLSDVPKANESVYEMTEPNQPIELWKGLARITEDIGQHDQEVTILFEWLPSPNLTFRFSYEPNPSQLASVFNGAHEITLRIQSDPKLEFSGFILTAPWQDGIQSVHGYIQELPGLWSSATNREVICHIPNLIDFIGEPVRKSGHFRRGRYSCEIGDWALIIDPIHANLKESRPKNLGDFWVQHVCLIQQKNGRAFNSQQLEPLRAALFYGLAFVSGRWCGPVLWVGRDNAESKPTWLDWRATRTSPNRNVRTWWTKQNPNGLQCLELLHDRLQEDTWKHALPRAISWYIESLKPGSLTEASLVTTQLAFECLADAMLVDSLRLVSARRIDHFKLEDKLRLMINSAMGPGEVPDALANLQRVAKARNWDTAECLAQLRNWEVHSTKNNRRKKEEAGINAEVLHEAMQLAIHSLQLVLLKVIGYEGKYLNMLIAETTSDIVPVPWASNEK